MKLERIQALPFLAATAVVLFHSVAAAEARGLPPHLFPWAIYGALGVDVFFVISGFIIHYTVTAGRLTASDFLRRRIERLVPIYWSFTFLLFAVGIWFPDAFRSGGPSDWMSLDNLLASLAFATEPTGRQALVFVGWTLEFEMLFYVTTAMLLLISPSPWRLLAWIFAVAVVLGRAVGGGADYFEFFTSPMLLEFAVGVAVADRLAKGRFDPFIYVPIGIGLLACVPSFETMWRISVALPAAWVVFSMVKAEMRSPMPHTPGRRVLSFLGDASYSIYLVQVLSVPASFKLAPHVVPQINLIAVILISCLATLLAGAAAYVLIERPLMHWFRKRRKVRGGRYPPVNAVPNGVSPGQP